MKEVKLLICDMVLVNGMEGIMKYNCCEYLLHQIVFDQFDIKPCCSSSMNNETVKFFDFKEGDDFDINRYIEKRKEYIEQFKQGIIPSCCEGCPIIKNQEWDVDEIYFDRIIIANKAKCSCNCIYCVYTHDNPEAKHFYNTRKSYDVIPILEQFRTKNLIKENSMIIIGGGEYTEFPQEEVDWIIYFASFMGCKISLLSSGIFYSEATAKILRSGSAELSISPDSGTEKTYKKIKQVNAFNKVWKNLEKYVQSAKDNPNSIVEIKYIIIPNINDSIDEFKAFIRKCQDIGCKNIHIDIEHYWFSEHKSESMPKSIIEIKKLINKTQNMNFTYSCETEYWFNQQYGQMS